MCFYYLLAGHLLGDFILQTDRIAANKAKDKQWSVLHATVVTLCILLFSVPFGLAVILLVLLNGVLHHLIDYYKSRIAERLLLPGLVFFLADQAVHILLLYAISAFAVIKPELLFFGSEWIGTIIVASLVSSFSAILNQYILSMLFPDTGKNFFEKDEKGAGNAARLLITFGLYLSWSISPVFILCTGAASAIYIYQYKRKWSTWMKRDYFFAKIILDVLISIAGVVLLLV